MGQLNAAGSSLSIQKRKDSFTWYSTLAVDSIGFQQLTPCTEWNSAEESRTFRTLYAPKNSDTVSAFSEDAMC